MGFYYLQSIKITGLVTGHSRFHPIIAKKDDKYSIGQLKGKNCSLCT